MKSTILRTGLAALACATVLAFASPSMAETVNFKASLSGKSEVPPNAVAGHRLGHRDLRYRQQETHLERQL